MGARAVSLVHPSVVVTRSDATSAPTRPNAIRCGGPLTVLCTCDVLHWRPRATVVTELPLPAGFSTVLIPVSVRRRK
jgi:hypothetical protein